METDQIKNTVGLKVTWEVDPKRSYYVDRFQPASPDIVRLRDAADAEHFAHITDLSPA